MTEQLHARPYAAAPLTLQRPSHTLVLESLERYLGPEEATEIWLAACNRVQIDPEAEQTPARDLLKAVDALDSTDCLVATCATGLRIRLMSYMILADKQQGVSTMVRIERTTTGC